MNCIISARVCPHGYTTIELTYDTPDTFNVEGCAEDPRPILQGGNCLYVYGGTKLIITPNFDEDYKLLVLRLRVNGADRVKIKVKAQKHNGFPLVLSENVSMICYKLNSKVGIYYT